MLHHRGSMSGRHSSIPKPLWGMLASLPLPNNSLMHPNLVPTHQTPPPSKAQGRQQGVWTEHWGSCNNWRIALHNLHPPPPSVKGPRTSPPSQTALFLTLLGFHCACELWWLSDGNSSIEAHCYLCYYYPRPVSAICHHVIGTRSTTQGISSLFLPLPNACHRNPFYC